MSMVDKSRGREVKACKTGAPIPCTSFKRGFTIPEDVRTTKEADTETKEKQK